MINNRYNKYLILLYVGVLLFCGCEKAKHSPYNKYGDKIDSLNIEEHSILYQENEFGLHSYSTTTYRETDSALYIIGYNHFEHSLDYFDITKGKMVSSLSLDREGVNGVVDKVCAMYPCGNDSLWVYDHVYIYLLNGDGKVQKKLFLGNYDQVKIENNHAMHTAKFLYDSTSSLIRYLNKSKDSFYITELSVEDGVIKGEYALTPSVVNDDGKKKFANMEAPNVLFQDERIVYNYPYESTIYVLDLKTKEHFKFGGESRFTTNVASECSDIHDYSKWERHGITNTHFYDVMYMPNLNMYARLHLSGVEFEADKNLSELGDSRELFLMLFDDEFNILGEFNLGNKTYNYFTGWCCLPNGLLIFKDNSLSGTEEYESILFDVITSVAVK